MKTNAIRAHISIKPFAWNDWPSLWNIRYSQLAEEGIILDPSSIPQNPQPGTNDQHEWDFHYIDQVYLRGAGNFWLAWNVEHPIGYIGGQDVGGVIELRRMYVKANYRQLGVGTLLVEALIAHSRTQGVHTIELWTAKNGPGRWLYHSLDFHDIEKPGKEFKDITEFTGYKPGADEIRMRLDM